MCFVKEIEIGNNEEGSGFNQFLSNLIFVSRTLMAPSLIDNFWGSK